MRIDGQPCIYENNFYDNPPGINLNPFNNDKALIYESAKLPIKPSSLYCNEVSFHFVQFF